MDKNLEVVSVGRATLQPGWHGEWQLRVDFKAVDHALDLALRTGRVVAVVGQDIHEETRAYADRFGRYVEYPSHIVDSSGSTLFSLIKPKYKGRSALFNRICSFLISRESRGLIDLNKSLNAKFAPLPLSAARSSIVDDFVRSRKKPHGAADAMEEFLDYAEKLEFNGPIVLQLHGHQPTIAQYIIFHNWALRSANIPCVLLSRDRASWQQADTTLERNPLSKAELFELVSKGTGNPVSDVERTFRLWSSTQRYLRNDKSSPNISLNVAEQFANFFRQFEEAVPNHDDLIAAAPAKVVAPIMFREEGAVIALDHRAVNDAPTTHVLGGARALRNQVAELLAAGMLDNSVPSASATFSRVAEVLSRIVSKGEADESDVVELGVEFSYLEGKVYEANDRIGALSRGPLLGFIGEMSRYLARFEAWNDYQAQGAAEPTLAVDLEIAQASVEILDAAASGGVLTDEAASRVKSAVEDDQLLASPQKRLGAARSTENLGAAMGRAALKMGKEAANELGNEAKERAVKELADASESFLKRNAGKFMKLAATRTGRWIAMVLEHLADQ